MSQPINHYLITGRRANGELVEMVVSTADETAQLNDGSATLCLSGFFGPLEFVAMDQIRDRRRRHTCPNRCGGLVADDPKTGRAGCTVCDFTMGGAPSSSSSSSSPAREAGA